MTEKSKDEKRKEQNLPQASPVVLLKSNPRAEILTIIEDSEKEIIEPYEALDKIKEILRKRK